MEKRTKPETSPSSGPDHSADTPARRNLLKKLAAGGTAAALLPTQWTKPIVESVVLPAHAQTTGCGSCSVVIQDVQETTLDDPTTYYAEIDAVSTADIGCNSGDVLAQLVDGGTPLPGSPVGFPASNESESVGTSCGGSVCVASVSLWVYSDSPIPSPLTIRFTWPGGCVAADSTLISNT